MTTEIHIEIDLDGQELTISEDGTTGKTYKFPEDMDIQTRNICDCLDDYLSYEESEYEEDK